MQERKTNHTLLCIVCEHMVFGVRQLQRINWARQPKREWCTRARRFMKELCMGVRELPIEDLFVRARHLPLEDLCVGVRSLQLEYMNRS